MFCNGDEDDLERFRFRSRDSGSPEAVARTPTLQRRERLKKSQFSVSLGKSKVEDVNNVMSAFQSSEASTTYGVSGVQASAPHGRKEPRDAAKRLLRSLSAAASTGELLQAVTKVVDALSSFDYAKCLYVASEIMTFAQANASPLMEELGGALLLLCYAECFFHRLEFMLYYESEMMDVNGLKASRVKPTEPINPESLYEEALDRMSELVDFILTVSTGDYRDPEEVLYGVIEAFWDGYLLSGNSVDTVLQQLIKIDGENLTKDMQSYTNSSLASPKLAGMDMEELEAYLDGGSMFKSGELALALQGMSENRVAKTLSKAAKFLDDLCSIVEIRLKLFNVYNGLCERFDFIGASRGSKRKSTFGLVEESEKMVDFSIQAKEAVTSCEELAAAVTHSGVTRILTSVLFESKVLREVTLAIVALSLFRVDRIAVNLYLARKHLVNFVEYVDTVSKEGGEPTKAAKLRASTRLKRRNQSAPVKATSRERSPATGRLTSCSEDVREANHQSREPDATVAIEKTQQVGNRGAAEKRTAAMFPLTSLLKSLLTSLELRSTVYFSSVFAHHRLDAKVSTEKLLQRLGKFVRNEARLRQHTVLLGLVLDAKKLEALGLNNVDHAKAQVSPCSEFIRPSASGISPQHLPLQSAPNGYFCPPPAAALEGESSPHFEMPVTIRIKDKKAVAFSKAVTLAKDMNAPSRADGTDIDPFGSETGMSLHPLIYSTSPELQRHLPNIVSLLMNRSNAGSLDSLQPLIHKEVGGFSYRLDQLDLAVTLVLVYKDAADWKEFSTIVALLRGSFALQAVLGNSAS